MYCTVRQPLVVPWLISSLFTCLLKWDECLLDLFTCRSKVHCLLSWLLAHCLLIILWSYVYTIHRFISSYSMLRLWLYVAKINSESSDRWASSNIRHLLFAQIIVVVCSNQTTTSNICYLGEAWLLLYNSWLLCLCNSWLLSLCNSWLAWKSWLNNFVCWFQGARAASARQGAGAASALQGAAG